jgi:hypothetical protein
MQDGYGYAFDIHDERIASDVRDNDLTKRRLTYLGIID